MELRDALRMLRSETGLTQYEFATAINVGYSAASRWENQNTRPNRSSSAAILALAKERCVSAVCLDALTSILLASRVVDKEDKAFAEEVTERMKVEQREFLSSEQLKAVIDNLDLAVIGHRIYADALNHTAVFYHNKRYAEIFGYDDVAEFDERSGENIYFGIPPESQTDYLKLQKKLLSGKIKLSEFETTLRGFKRNGEEIWLEVKGISMARFSFGYELFISCRDATAQINAERKYAEEVAVRNASIQVAYASLYCDLKTSAIFRYKDLEKVTGQKYAGETIDKVFEQLAQVTLDGPGREEFCGKLCRRSLLAAYDRGETLNNVRLFNTVARRWMRVDCVLIKNPYTGHSEATIYIYDIQSQMCAEKMTHIVADKFFEYIGIIDAVNKTFESYYYDTRVFRQTVSGARDYTTTCEEKLRLYACPDDVDSLRTAICLETIRKRLDHATFYTTALKLKDHEGATRIKRLIYTYLDETKTKIIMAQSDRENINKTLHGNGASRFDKAKATRQLK